MGLRYKKSDIDWSIRALSRANSELKGWIADEMDAIRPQVESLMKMYSDFQKERISGDMIAAMRAEVSGTKTQLRFGFIGENQNYFGYQTVSGFTHWLSGQFIAPSLALSDAKEDAVGLMREASLRVRTRYMNEVSR